MREVEPNGKENFSPSYVTVFRSLDHARVTITHYDSSGDYTAMGSKSFSDSIGSITVCKATSGGSITALGR